MKLVRSVSIAWALFTLSSIAFAGETGSPTQFHAQLKKEFTERIEKRLAEKGSADATTLTDASQVGGESVARKLR